MTQPIQEPSDSRKFSKLTYGQDQLFRRPAPVTDNELPWARAQKTFSSSLQSIPNNSNTPVDWTEYVNIGAGESGEDYFDDTGGAEDLVLLIQGVYLIKIFVGWGTTAVGNFRGGVSVNAALIDWCMERNTSLFGGQSEFNAATFAHCTGSSTLSLSLVLYQSSGASRNLDSAYLHAVYLGSYTGLDWDAMDPDQP